jgi:hypothetical protein
LTERQSADARATIGIVMDGWTRPAAAAAMNDLDAK